MSFADHLPVVQAVEKATGQRPHIQTVRRWIKKGLGGVKLQASFVNGKYLTSIIAVQEFIDATTEARLQCSESPKLDPVKPVRPTRVASALKEFERMTKGLRGNHGSMSRT